MNFSAFEDIDLHKSFSLNDAIMQVLFNSTQLSEFKHNEHFGFEAYDRITNLCVDIKSFSACLLDQYKVIPVVNEVGIKFVRDSTDHLTVIKHSLVYDEVVALDAHSLKKVGTASNSTIRGCIFSGEYRDEPIYGYISTDEVLSILSMDRVTDIRLIQSMLFETSLYRAMQRIDRALLPGHFTEFQEIHELRNFIQFRKDLFSHDAFLSASKVVSSREDYLMAVSPVWRRNFHAQMTYLCFALAELAGGQHLEINEVVRLAYICSSDAASQDADLSPINGSHYLLALTDDESNKLSVAVRETVNGKLKRCYDNAGLLNVKADVVYSTDIFEFDSSKGVRHRASNFNNLFGNRGDPLGAYCTLTFHDLTQMTEFVDIHELTEVADCSGVETWGGLFADRMKIKHAISTALSACSWDHKSLSPTLHHY